MTTVKQNVKNATPAKDDGGNAVLSVLRSGIGALEHGTMSAAEWPLSVMSGLGVPESATDKAREGSRQVLHGVNGTIDTLATQTFKIAGKGASLVTGAVSAVKP